MVRKVVEASRRRIRNSPCVKEVIQQYLRGKRGGASFDEICEHVMKSVTLLGKTPRNSVYSTLFRMRDVRRVGRKWRIVRGQGDR